MFHYCGYCAMHLAWRYAAFPERPFAFLEVKPASMDSYWFQRYHPAAYSLDTWVYTFEASNTLTRRSGADGPQQQAAELPHEVFEAFVCNVSRRFIDTYAMHTAP